MYVCMLYMDIESPCLLIQINLMKFSKETREYENTILYTCLPFISDESESLELEKV